MTPIIDDVVQPAITVPTDASPGRWARTRLPGSGHRLALDVQNATADENPQVVMHRVGFRAAGLTQR